VHVLVLYESRRGFTMGVAGAIRDDLRARGEQATCAAFGTVDPGTYAAADALVVGTWIQGLLLFRVGPAEGALAGVAELPELEGRPAAVFCTYDVTPFDSLTRLANRLKSRGARVVPVRGRFRRRKKLEGVPAFVDAVVEAFTDAGANERIG
jgi:hypothetical protein